MSANPVMRVLLVDPSLFTAPYDAALTEGLLSAGVLPTWAVRPTRPGDRQELPEQYVDAFFYRRSDRMPGFSNRLRAVAKGLSHALGLAQLVLRVGRQRPAVVHFQWALVPALDSLAILLIRCFSPVVSTVHDTTPFNGERLSFLQNLAFDLPGKLSSGVVVHTEAGRKALIARGVPVSKITVIPHGPLPLHATPSATPGALRADTRWTFVLFGEIKPYKGLDLLVEALNLVPKALRANARVIVAGRPRMDLAPVRARIDELGLGGVIEIRAKRLSEQEMADLFAESDCFLFPYRQIDASGVYFLVQSLSKWLIASRVGVFAEELSQAPERGALVPPHDASALAEAIAEAITRRPAPPPGEATKAWPAIGAETRRLYQTVLDNRRTSLLASFARGDSSG